ncbi:MAG: DNA replication/repair protein RecF [Pseudomonadales bacterium]|nr:DNA replication/repair protein RecF [Pseudomonadales bacterium]
MPALLKLNVTNLRNITSLELRFSPGCNVFYGENGSGKTTLLEAIHMLGLARSFRSTQLASVVQSGQRECTIHGELDDGASLGISKSQHGPQQIRVSGQRPDNIPELARSLPLQLLNAETYKILEGSPKIRRHFMDWGVFHVERFFVDCWKQAQRALQNRNRLLRNQASRQEIEPWSHEFSRHGMLLDQFRLAYVEKLIPVLNEILQEILPIEGLGLEYDRGWEAGSDLMTVLAAGLERDYRYGYTVAGPQRADIRIRIGKQAAIDILSRGQQKLLVSSLKIAQGHLLQQETGKECLYLVDDLPAELDEKNRRAVCRMFEKLGTQVFITGVDKAALDACWQALAQRKVFHVKHGRISPDPESEGSAE